MKIAPIIFLIILINSILLSTNAQVINMNDVTQEWNTDLNNRNVELNELRTLLKRDAIPPIDNPEFWKSDKAFKTYFKNEPVTVVEFNGEAKAYPHSILMFHEIVNDVVGGTYVSITYCPLCNSALVFNRNVRFDGNDYFLDFGTSGMLRKSNLVMWDRQTETWWQQLSGTGIVGKLAGAELEFLSSKVLSLTEYFDNNPDGQVLSTKTSTSANKSRYGSNPYVKYDDLENNAPRLFFEEVDPRLPAMERVVHVPAGDIDKVFAYSLLQEKHVINDESGSEVFVLFHEFGSVSVLDEKDIREGKDLGSVTVFNRNVEDKALTFKFVKGKFIDDQTGSSWNINGKCIKGKLMGKQLMPRYYGVHFAFAWFSFYPESVLYTE